MTRNVRKFGLITWLMILSMRCAPAISAPSLQARALSWTVHAKASLLNGFPDIGSVNKFINSILPHDELSIVDVKEYTFADLKGDGSLELIASLSDGGKGSFYPTILVVAELPTGFVYSEAYNGGAMDVPALDEVLVHITGRRGLELLLPRRLGPYEGARPVPIVYDIYQFKGGRVQQADLEFGNYYVDQLLPKLHAEVLKKTARIPSGNGEIDDQMRHEIAAQQDGVTAMEKMLVKGIVPSCTYSGTDQSSTPSFNCKPY